MRIPTARRGLKGVYRRRAVAGVAGTLGVALFASLGAGTAAAASGPCGATGVLSGSDPFTCTYSKVGSDTFTVPADVVSASFDVIGAIGGSYFVDGDVNHPDPTGLIVGSHGGGGGAAAGTLALTSSSVLQVDVAGYGITGTAASRSGGMMNGISGGSGALGGFGGSDGGVAGGPGDAGGANGGTAFNGGNGGGGGGASDVRVDSAGCSSLTCPLSDVVFVGAGGGGAGGNGGQGNAQGGAGGNGGGTSGANGVNGGGGNPGALGSGATPTAGGAGGLNPGLHAAGAVPTDPRYGGDGATGASGPGGTGGAGNLPCTGTQTPPCSGGQNATTSGGGAGGGGGGGYFGGGGGSGGGGLFGGAGGAGGGAGGGGSFVAASATNPTITAGANANTSFVSGPSTGPDTYVTAGSVNGGNGQVTITWTAPQTAAACVVTAIRRPGVSGMDEEDVTVTDPNGVASIANVAITNGQVFVGGSSGTRIDPGGTTLSADPTSVVLTAVKTTQGVATQWSFDATNTEGNTTHCA